MPVAPTFARAHVGGTMPHRWYSDQNMSDCGSAGRSFEAARRSGLDRLSSKRTKRPNSATHITQLGRSEIEQILVVRRVLEGFAFEEAARKATNGRISLLETLHQEAVEAARASDYQAYIHADLLWHDAVWQTTANEALRGTLRRLVLPLFGFSAIRVASREGFDLRQDAYSHLPLLEGIRKRDPGATRRAFDVAYDAWSARLLEAEPAPAANTGR